MSKEPVISIVASAYSAQRLVYLKRLLQSISKQKQDNIESVVVVDASEQVLQEITNALSVIESNRHQIFHLCGKSGASAARNAGARIARGRYVAFLDDDVVLCDDWALNVLKSFSEIPELSALTGSAEPLWEDLRDSWLPTSLYWVISCTGYFGNVIKITKNLWAANMVIKKDVFFFVGGFDENLGPHKGRKGYHSIAEDLEFTIRLNSKGYLAFYIPSVKCYHNVRHTEVSFRYILERAYWIGRERRLLIKKQYLTDAEVPVLRMLLSDFVFSMTSLATLSSFIKQRLAIIISVFGALIGFLTSL
jgi:glycosyltransferase involved in cell wall biosynthesis